VSKAIELSLPDPPEFSKALSLRTLFSVLVAGSISLLILLIAVCYWTFAILPLRAEIAQRDAMIQRQDMLSHFGQLAAELAHEIRNPLTAINARLYTLQKSISAGTPEFTDAGIIKNEITRLDGIVKDFLKVARPAEPRFVSVSAGPLLNEVQELLAPQCEKNAIELKCEVEQNVVFRGDPQQLKQVLINLVQNAAESIGHEGTIVLRGGRARIDLNGKPSKAVFLEVQDSGPGISREVRERLFDPFFSTKKTGTGLGLAISARIIEKHFGVLNFESENGRTVFRIAVPIRRD
jgi:signal transduction histidine kinase